MTRRLGAHDFVRLSEGLVVLAVVLDYAIHGG